MKNITVVLSSLSLIGVLVLFGMHFSGQKQNSNTSVPVPVTASGGPNRIAYVNIDSLEAKYEVLKTKRDEFKHRQEQMESELQRSYGQMQSDANEVQKKAQANTLTQAEYEAAQKRLGQMQQSLESRKQSLTDQLVKEQDDFNKQLKSSLDAFLEEYNKTRHYDYIFSNAGAGSAVLYANKAFDITRDVVDGLNAQAKNQGNKK
jgi:outer membrane protein